MAISKFLRRMASGPASEVSSVASDTELIAEQFDADFYRKTYSDLSAVENLIGHYVLHGWREGRDPAPWFCVKDYLVAYPDVAAAGIEPLTHFVVHGKGEAREAFPVKGSEAWERREFIRSTGMHRREFPPAFNAQAYAQAAGLGDADRWQALTHFFHHGMFNPALIEVSEAEPELIAAIGDLAGPTDENKAARCYELAVYQGLRDSRIMHELGDIYLRRNQPFNAVTAFKTSIELGSQYFWTHFNLGQALCGLGSFDEALAQCETAFKRRPEMRIARYERDRIAAERFGIEWSRANALSIEGDDEAASSRMAEAIGAYREVTAADTEELPYPCRGRRARLRIAIFGSDSLSQCKLYRITQKIDQLGAVDQQVDVFALSQAQEFGRRISLYDIAIIYRAPATPEVIDVLGLARKFGVTTFYDIDDLIFDDRCYPPSRAALEGMVTPSEYAGLVTGRALFREAMALCDFGIASTPPIQAVMASVVRRGRCFLSRNALGRSHLHELKRIAETGRDDRTDRSTHGADQPFVFFYGSGSRSHNENFAIMAPALAKVMRNHPHTRLRVFGPVELGKVFDGLESRIERLGFTTDLGAYWKALTSADVNLAPLTPGAFNDGKSEIKWMEAAMLGVPSVVSASAVYDELIVNGQDGWIARAPKDWLAILDQLVRQPQSGVGAAARARVLTEYDLREGGENLLAIVREGLSEISAGVPAVPRKPRLLVVNIFYPPEFIGGATRVVEQVVADIVATHSAIFDIEVLCGREPDGKPGFADRYTWHGVPVTTLAPFTDGDAIERSVDTATFFEGYLDLVQPDIIHFHCIQRLTASLVDVAADRAIPFIVTVHDGWWISDRQFLVDEGGTPVYESGDWGDPRRLDRLRGALARARATVAVSRSQEQLYRSRGIANVITIGNGSDALCGVSPAPVDGPVWLGLLGGLGLAKGADLLQQALTRRRFGNLRFLVVDHRMLEGTARTELWGSNEVEIVGKASFANVARVYSRLHVVLAISVCVESFGLVAREARRLGRWVIASDRGGIGEDVIEGEDGFVIDPARIETLLAVLDRIDADPALFRGPLPERPELRDRRAVADDYVALYSSILAETAHGQA